LEAALYKGERKDEKAMIHMDSPKANDTFEFEFSTVPSLLNDVCLDNVESDCYIFSQSQSVVLKKHHIPAHVEFSQILHDDCSSFSIDSGRPPESNVMYLENTSYLSDISWVHGLPNSPNIAYMRPFPRGLISWGGSFRRCPKNFAGFKHSCSFVSHVVILLSCYLCFCVAHAQAFDKLMRALSYFDGHLHALESWKLLS